MNLKMAQCFRNYYYGSVIMEVQNFLFVIQNGTKVSTKRSVREISKCGGRVDMFLPKRKPYNSVNMKRQYFLLAAQYDTK